MGFTISLLAFWVSASVIAYIYAGYPLLLATGVLARRKPVQRGPIRPKLSVIIAAHNEESVIAAKLANVAAFAYPLELVEVLVGADGCSDRTAAIVRGRDWAVLYEGATQCGKSAVQNELVNRSSGDILLFTDADCFAAPDAVSTVIENFADPTVGVVTARPIYRNEGENNVTNNEGLYLRYESWLQWQESSRGLLAMASGSFFAIRRNLWAPLQRNFGDDFVLPLQAAIRGFRTVAEPGAHVETQLTQNRLTAILAMRRRVISKDLLGLLHYREALNPFRTGGVAIALWSHKLLRWLVPYFLLVAFIANLFLLSRRAFAALFVLQVLFYLLAAIGPAVRSRRLQRLWSVPASFCIANMAALLATLQCALGKTSGQWKPAR